MIRSNHRPSQPRAAQTPTESARAANQGWVGATANAVRIMVTPSILLDRVKTFTQTVNMCTLVDKTFTPTEKVVHVAYGCGCVRTFHVEHRLPDHLCSQHGDRQLSFTEEEVPVARSAA